MIIHKTSYGLFYEESDKSKIIADCKRSSGNACKIYHHIKNAEIIKSYLFNHSTKELITFTPTSTQKNIAYNEIQIAKGKNYETR